MELDTADVFRDDDACSENDFYQERQTSKEYVVYVVDVSPKMFSTTCPAEVQKDETHFHIAVSCIAQSLKTQIISSSYDEVAICLFNTVGRYDKSESSIGYKGKKKNLQDLNGVFVFNVAEQEHLDRPTARFIKEFEHIEEYFEKEIGSQYGIISGSRGNSLYNVLWVAQGLLRKGSAKTAAKRILLFTNEDDPFGSIKGAAKTDMTRTTMQRAKDAQDLGISIDLLPLSLPDVEFNVSHFYADMIGLGGDDLALFMPYAGQKLEDMKDQLRKRMFTKRIVRRISFVIANGLSIELSTYALIRPTVPGAITWLDSVTNRPIKIERSFICADTGALMQDPAIRFQPYRGENLKFSVQELSEIKRVSMGHLRLLGFKRLRCLKDYHNLRPSTFVFPSDKEVVGSTCTFIALHRSMLQLKRLDEIVSAGGQVEPPGMHMVYLPYSDDIRPVEELHSDTDIVPRASDDQVKKAAALMKRIDLKDFSVCQFANPSLQRHYAVLQALALEEDEMPEIEDETVPDEEGMARPEIVKLIEEFNLSVYGDNYDEENDLASDVKVSEASRKRKAAAENAAKECANSVWADLADNGKLKDLKVPMLKYYLMAHNLCHTGRKEVLISRILTHMGK